jgi:hypothetical protein
LCIPSFFTYQLSCTSNAPLSHIASNFLYDKIRYMIVEERAQIVKVYKGGVKSVEIASTLGHVKTIMSIALKDFESCQSL